MRPALVLLAVLATATPRASRAPSGLTGMPKIAAAYDAILAAQFDRAEQMTTAACPPAPSGACADLRVVTLWWRININPESRALDERFTTRAAAAVAENTAWTEREPSRAEAWFYLAGAYAPLVQWKILRGERVSAARDGNRIRAALERALELDPSLDDAYFGIGLYHYYAAVAPTYAKFLRWLMLMPGGDRARGLGEMTRARSGGGVLAGEADYQLVFVYLWYEHRVADALTLLDGLDRRYPSNPLFLQRGAEIRANDLHDARAAATTWTALLTRARNHTVALPEISEIRARLGLASALIALGDRDRAREQLQIVIDAKPNEPIGASTRAQELLRETQTPRKF